MAVYKAQSERVGTEDPGHGLTRRSGLTELMGVELLAFDFSFFFAFPFSPLLFGPHILAS